MQPDRSTAEFTVPARDRSASTAKRLEFNDASTISKSGARSVMVCSENLAPSGVFVLGAYLQLPTVSLFRTAFLKSAVCPKSDLWSGGTDGDRFRIGAKISEAGP